MNSVDDDGADSVLPQMWQYIHPLYNTTDSSTDSDTDDVDDARAGANPSEEEQNSKQRAIADTTNQPAVAALRPRDYVKLSKRAPRLGQLIRYFNDIIDDEELTQVVLSKDPVTAQTILQWAAMHDHFLLVEYLVKRLRRAAFAFDPDATDVMVYHQWEEMRPELPSAAEVAERTRQRELKRAARAVERAARVQERRRRDDDNPYSEDDEDENVDEYDEDNNDSEEGEPLPEELVYDSLEELHDELGPQGLSRVKRIGELGVYVGTRWRDGTKQGMGQTLFVNGDCYAGEYKANQRNGKGVFWWKEAVAVYCGQWSNNARSGYGRMVYPDGSRYLGQWRHNRKHGRGRYCYADGSSYDGVWVNDEKHGHGAYHFANGSAFVGTFLHNEFVSGEWRLACGTVRYVGNFVHGRPVGMGMFVHRGVKGESFQQEGVFLEDGRWMANRVTGTSSKESRVVEMRVPHAPNTLVPVEFAPECTGLGIIDLVRAINFEPFMDWVNALSTATNNSNDNRKEATQIYQQAAETLDKSIHIKKIQVMSISYSNNNNNNSETRQGAATTTTPSRATGLGDEHEVVEVRIRPTLTDAEGRRVRAVCDDILAFTKPTTRLLILLEPQNPSYAAGTQKENESHANPDKTMVILEKRLRFASADAGHTQWRLPAVRVAATGSLHGDIVDCVGRALRLDLCSTDCTIRLIDPPQQCHSTASNATEATLLYVQQVHRDTFVTLLDKLRNLSPYPQLLEYTAVPLNEVLTLSSDAATVIAAAAVQRRRESHTLPQSTTAPQCPPTPVLPAPLTRPNLQPLYEARIARHAQEGSAEA